MSIEAKSRQVLQSALKPVRRRSFIRSYLLVLWPDSERLLLEMARRLGGEVRAPGETTPLLTASLGAGIGNFDRHRIQESYNPGTWVANMYLHFWRGALETAALVMGIRGRASGGVWDPARQPFLDWRSEQPGEVAWEYRPVARLATEAERLYRLLLGREGPRPYVVREVLRRLGDGK